MTQIMREPVPVVEVDAVAQVDSIAIVERVDGAVAPDVAQVDSTEIAPVDAVPQITDVDIDVDAFERENK